MFRVAAYRATSAALVIAAGFAGSAAHAGSASFEIRGYVPLICKASLQDFNVSGRATLRVDAVVNQHCNSKHVLSVRYEVPNGIDPSALQVDLAGRRPVLVTATQADFSEERYAKTARPITILYSGGTPEQRQQLAQTITIVVSPL